MISSHIVQQLLDLTTTKNPITRYRYPIHDHYYNPDQLELQVAKLLDVAPVPEIPLPPHGTSFCCDIIDDPAEANLTVSVCEGRVYLDGWFNPGTRYYLPHGKSTEQLNTLLVLLAGLPGSDIKLANAALPAQGNPA